MTKRTQMQKVFAHLKSGRRITALGALQQYGIIQLPKRIYDIRLAGFTIEKDWVTTQGRDGQKIKYASYYMKEAQ